MNSHGENAAGVIAAVANEKCGIGLAYNAKNGGKTYYRYSLDYLNSVILTVGRSNPSKDICLGVRCSKVKGSIICGGFSLFYFSPTRMEMRMTLFFNIDILIFIIYMKKLRASDWLKASAFFM